MNLVGGLVQIGGGRGNASILCRAELPESWASWIVRTANSRLPAPNGQDGAGSAQLILH